MGSAVSLLYGSGGLGMLFGLLKGDEDFYDKAEDVYQTGMFNQNQIFASMNFAVLLKRIFNKNQLPMVDRSEDNIKAKIEVVDSLLFLPNIITRAVGTLDLFGMEVNESLDKLVRALGYFSYGTWAARFGILKKAEEFGGDLVPLKEDLQATSKKVDLALHDIQKAGGWVFSTTLPILSWLSAAFELFGYREIANKAFKLEGYFERLNPMIAAWCIRDTWFKWFTKEKVSSSFEEPRGEKVTLKIAA